MAKKPSYEELEHEVDALKKELANCIRSEDVLGESEDMFMKAFRSSPAAMVISTLTDGKVMYINDSFTRSTGYSNEEALGRTLIEIGFWITLKDRDNLIEKLRQNGSIPDLELEFNNKAGEARLGLFSFEVLNIKGDECIIIAMKDTTEQRRAENALRESEEKYKVLVESFIDGVSVVQGKTIRFANQSILHMFHCKHADEMLGHTFTEFVSPKSRELMSTRGRAREEGHDVPTRYEFKALRKDGKEFDAEISVSSITFQGRPARQGIVRDITDRKRAEEAVKAEKEKLNNIVRGIGAGLSLLDEDTRIIWCNDILRQWFGADVKILGKHCFELYDLKNPQKECAALLALRTGEIERGEAFGHTIKGEERFFQLVTTPIKNKAGRIVQLLELSQDITERKQAEELLKAKEAELRSKAKRLEEVNTALRVLLKGRQENKKNLEEKVRSNVKDLVLPYLEKLKKTSHDANQISCISILESNLKEIISPFALRLSSKYLALTPTEIRVADLVRDGKTTKEIAEFMHLSSKTIQTHRDNIRKKFGIKHKKTNLRIYLSLLG